MLSISFLFSSNFLSCSLLFAFSLFTCTLCYNICVYVCATHKSCTWYNSHVSRAALKYVATSSEQLTFRVHSTYTYYTTDTLLAKIIATNLFCYNLCAPSQKKNTFYAKMVRFRCLDTSQMQEHNGACKKKLKQRSFRTTTFTSYKQ